MIGRDAQEWSRQWPAQASRACRVRLLAYAYLLGAPVEETLFLRFERLGLARTVFGPEIVGREVDTVYGLLRRWGYHLETAGNRSVRTLIAHAMLLNRSPLLADMDAALLERLRRAVRSTGRASGDLHSLQRALAALGRCEPPVARNQKLVGQLRAQRWTDVPAPWAEMVCRWFDTSTLSRNVRMAYRQDLARIGRWLAAEYPQITEPAQWTRTTCAAWVATVDRMRIGNYVERTATRGVFGDPMSPSTKDSALSASRAFLRDLQEWEWIPRRFDPGRALETPRSIRALPGPTLASSPTRYGPSLLWAGINLISKDLPTSSSGPRYPLELSRAVALTWLFSGQRSDEIRRLRTGCVRWQHGRQPGCRRRARPRRRLPTGRPDPQNRHQFHQAGRPVARTGHRGLAGRPPRAAGDAGRQDRRARALPVHPPRPARLQGLHQPHRTIEVLVDRDAVASGRRPPASPGSTTTWATAGAPTPSSNSANTGWPAPVATSTPPRAPARPNSSKPGRTCSACSPPSR
ncbi:MULTISPECIES: hypothetical protein [unclassified Streptomyces]|uniref:hypothetical protein n=1 Tax=unclassified Streptomyces TaxID=2593676 RepID=UPI0033BDAA9A